jgi:hypothetical protein
MRLRDSSASVSVVDVLDVLSRAFKVLDASDDALQTVDIYRLIPGNWVQGTCRDCILCLFFTSLVKSLF